MLKFYSSVSATPAEIRKYVPHCVNNNEDAAMVSNRQRKRQRSRTYSSEGREALRASDAADAASPDTNNTVIHPSQTGSSLIAKLRGTDLQSLITFIEPLPFRFAKAISDITKEMLSSRREIRQKETAVTKFNSKDKDGKPFTSSEMLSDDPDVIQAIEEAEAATVQFKKAMSEQYKKIAELEVNKRKEKFQVVLMNSLHKVTQYSLLFYKIKRRDEPGFVAQTVSDERLVFDSMTTYLSNLPNGFARRFYADSNMSLVAKYKVEHPLVQASPNAQNANGVNFGSNVSEMEVENEANPTFNVNAPQDPDRLPALGIADAQYITAMIEKLADIIPRITVNLWDELTQRDQFRELNAQLEQLDTGNRSPTTM